MDTKRRTAEQVKSHTIGEKLHRDDMRSVQVIQLKVGKKPLCTQHNAKIISVAYTWHAHKNLFEASGQCLLGSNLILRHVIYIA